MLRISRGVYHSVEQTKDWTICQSTNTSSLHVFWCGFMVRLSVHPLLSLLPLPRYYKPETRGLDFEGLMEDIKVRPHASIL